MPLRRDDAMFGKTLLAMLAALLLSYCTTTTTPPAPVPPGELGEDQRPDASLDASADTSAIAIASGRESSRRLPLLAIEVEITTEGVKPLGVRIMQAPPLANSAHGDLHVKIQGVARQFEYTIADPLVATVHDEEGTREITLQSARTHVFAPLLPGLSTLSIEPATHAEALRTRGGRIDLRELAKQACQRTPLQLPVCNQILGQP